MTIIGLNMWAFKIRKTTEKEAVAVSKKSFDEIEKAGFSLIPLDENENVNKLTDLLEYGRKIIAKKEDLPLDKLKKVRGIPKEAELCSGLYDLGKSSYFLKFYNSKTNEKIEVYVSDKEYGKLKETINICSLIYHSEIIAYLGKDYQLQDRLSQLYCEEQGKYIENCGFHKMSSSMLEAASIYETLNDDEAIFYHEWY